MTDLHPQPARSDSGADTRYDQITPDKGRTLLQRVIMPRSADPLDVRTLYFDEDQSNSRRAKLLHRGAVQVPASSGISFAAYFNAFPAAYWLRWTTLREVVLHVQVEGRARVDIYRSKADGASNHVTGTVLDGSVNGGTGEFVLDLAPFQDGGWYWFDVTTDDEPATVLDSGWYATVEPARTGKVAVGICTYNRPDDCVAALQALGEDPLVLDELQDVFVADQGDRKVVDAPGFADAARVLGDRLHFRDQPNLGGSGGFSRAMYETLHANDAEYLLLMDDDIVIEPDSVLRALTFARFARTVSIVGGQMLALQKRSVLHSFGEVIDRQQFSWREAPNAVAAHDFAEESLRETPKLHRRIDVDYNGWWMCLIPRVVIEKIGLPIPLFIKWDDAEFGLRAGEAGFPTITVPGVAIWHISWTDKDDVVDWQAYFHIRNRLIVAALHSPYRNGGTLPRHVLKMTLRHLMTLNYSAAELHHRAIEDFLNGPAGIPELLPTAMGEIRRIRAEYSDGVVQPSSTEVPRSTMDPVRAERFGRIPTNPLTIATTLARGLAHNVTPVAEKNRDRPQLNVAAQDARWFLLSRLDSATVGTSDGRGFTFRKRDPELFRKQLRQAMADYALLKREFGRKRVEYRTRLGELTSIETWESLYGS